MGKVGFEFGQVDYFIRVELFFMGCVGNVPKNECAL